MLSRTSLLDPRSRVSRTVQNSVNIPWVELSDRVHELPPKGKSVSIVDFGEESKSAFDWLVGNGRLAELTSDIQFGDRGKFRLWSPNAFLESCLPQIPTGNALDLACGSGRDAVYMASREFQVTAIDHLPDAIALGQDLERRYAEGSPKIDWICMDLKATSIASQWDLMTCFFFLDRSVLTDALNTLRPGGHLVFETFTSHHRETLGKPRSLDFVLQPNELLDLARGLEIMNYEESWHGDRHTAQLWAKRPEF